MELTQRGKGVICKNEGKRENVDNNDKIFFINSRMTHQEINAFLKIAPINANGYFDYKQFVQTIHGEEQEQ